MQHFEEPTQGEFRHGLPLIEQIDSTALPQRNMSECKTCGKPLTVEIDPEEEDDEYDQASFSGHVVPDSVELQWYKRSHEIGAFYCLSAINAWYRQCLLDAYEINECRSCSRNILSHTSSGTEQILCNVNNEGGLQEGFDILPILKEESYLKAFPEERKCRALLEFCADGDVGAVLDLITDQEDEDFSANGNGNGSAKPIDVLRYQDPLGSMSTGLHIAIENGHEEIAWLLLLLASNLELKRFPEDVLQAAETLGARRQEQTGKVDIRIMEDAAHRTAENLAKQLGGKWDEWVQSERLKPILDGILPIRSPSRAVDTKVVCISVDKPELSTPVDAIAMPPVQSRSLGVDMNRKDLEMSSDVTLRSGYQDDIVEEKRTMGSVVLPHLTTGWHVDQAILTEEERLVVIRFGRDWDPDCMRQDEVLYRIADRVKNFAVIYVCDLDQVPDFKQMYELYDRMTLMFFFRNKHMMCDFGTGNNNKLNWVLEDKQELIDIMETIYRGAKKGRGLVITGYLQALPKEAGRLNLGKGENMEAIERKYCQVNKCDFSSGLFEFHVDTYKALLLTRMNPPNQKLMLREQGCHQPYPNDVVLNPNTKHDLATMCSSTGSSSQNTLMSVQIGPLQHLPVIPEQDGCNWPSGILVALALKKQHTEARTVQGRRLGYCGLEYKVAPKKKPLPPEQPPKDASPAPRPKKYVAFSSRDSRAIESAFRRLVEEEDHGAREDDQNGDIGSSGLDRAKAIPTIGNSSAEDGTKKSGDSPTKVPVNEDFLFDVDIEKRELAPAYWLGPIYDVRRGSWFYQEGSTVRPCDENLANQLEEGYLKTKPWRYEAESQMPAQSQSRPRSQSRSAKGSVPPLDGATASKPVLEPSAEDLEAKADNREATTPISVKFQLQTQRLFGAYMNSVVTYQNANTAWILTDDLYSRMSSTVYQRFAGGGHLGGTKVVRGFTESGKAKDKKSEAGQTPEIEKPDNTGKTPRNQKRRSAPPEIATSIDADMRAEEPHIKGQSAEDNVQQESKIAALERQMSNIVSSPEPEDPAKQDEQVRKGDEDEIEQDYKEADGDDPGREIEHLILVTHGIGQRLGLRVENLNFIRDVNKFRKTLKSVYDASPDLQALNNELDKLPKNCRVQVLPVVWRHLLDFPKQSFRQNGKEQDLTDADAFGEEEKYPSLDDITVEGVPGIRNLITDLALDILLYQSAYREHIAGIVQRECNRIYGLFLQRNPKFSGKISLVGHSLGSAILFDILCRQKDSDKSLSLPQDKSRSRRVGSLIGQSQSRDLGLNFDVESFFCLGSPLGLYQMLKGRKIAARDTLQGRPRGSSIDSSLTDDPFLGGPSVDPSAAIDSDSLSITVSSPKCQELFNIFHPADAIAYRLEPLISPAMSSLKPQPLPYTKRGIFTPGQGFTGIGARVGQSVSGLWTNITSGVASSLLNRSLGISGDGQGQPTQSIAAPTAPPVASSATVDASTTGGDVREEAHPQTLIDNDIETLYAGFQKRRRSQQSDDARDLGERPEWQDADVRAKKLQREEAKVRALNSNGRVDFSIQE
ncbi:MAG: hypothetical protein Q9216_003803 [Gyalolechia sp. 2 TL-2023]